MKISVCIASMGRPSLVDTIASVQRAIAVAGLPVEIIVADDSADGAAATLLADHPAITIVPIAAANVSLARNGCLDHACGEWVLFVDDDEYVDEQWLLAHLAVAERYAADVVLGPVYHLYPADTAAWFRAVDPLFQDWGWAETGRVVTQGRTGNTLVRRAFITAHQLRFDPRFGRSGGEDHDFFRRLSALGGKMVVTDQARAWETVPASRATPSYILRRALRSGQTHALVTLRDARLAGRTAFAVSAALKLTLAACGSLLLAPFSRANQFRLRIKAATNYGKLLGLTDAALASSWD